MKNRPKNEGFILPLVLIVAAVLLISAGFYIHNETKNPNATINSGVYGTTTVTNEGEGNSGGTDNNPSPNPEPIAVDSGIQGTAIISPTCPVQQQGQDCSRPFQGGLQLETETGVYVQNVIVNSNGSYKITVPPGKYKFVTINAGLFPRLADPGIITVVAHQYTTVNLSFDSGIR